MEPNYTLLALQMKTLMLFVYAASLRVGYMVGTTTRQFGTYSSVTPCRTHARRFYVVLVIPR